MNAHRRLLAPALTILLVACVVAATAWISHGNRSTPAAKAGVAHHTRGADGVMAPGAPPAVVIYALGATGERRDNLPVLARTPMGTPVTVRARLYFRDKRPGRARDNAIVIARPGAEPEASPEGADRYYRSVRVAISSRVNLTSPQQRILTLTTPADLRPGTYPVLTVEHASPLSGPFGRRGQLEEGTTTLGVVIVTGTAGSG